MSQCVPPTTRLFADIGTNHGILPIAVLRDGRAERCIGADRSGPSLADTARRIRRCQLEQDIELRLGDGLEPVADEPDLDVVCVAGVGSRTILEILDTGLARLHHESLRLILNPLSRLGGIREYLATSEFVLTDDFVVEERGRSYSVLVADRLT